MVGVIHVKHMMHAKIEESRHPRSAWGHLGDTWADDLDVHDGNFSIDGLLFPDGSPHPGLFEVLRVFSPVEVLVTPVFAPGVLRGEMMRLSDLSRLLAGNSDSTAPAIRDLDTGPADNADGPEGTGDATELLPRPLSPRTLNAG
jgi:hypothetical protein